VVDPQLDSNAQLENISKLKVYSYKFTDEFADYAGLPENARHETGVLAQDVKDVLPDAVIPSHNLTLPTGDVIQDFLVVNKVGCYILKCYNLLSQLTAACVCQNAKTNLESARGNGR